MKAITLTHFGDVDALNIASRPMPEIGMEEVLIKVHATALNRADLLQRRGLYPPPPGESDILGLEVAGEIMDMGAAVTGWQIGDRVLTLLAGGGYAQYAKAHHNMLIPFPSAITMEQAAGIAEAFLTAWQALVWLGDLQKAERVLIHAGASGVGTAATQIAKVLGAEVIITASREKHALCHSLGADQCIDYKTVDFAAVLKNGADPGVDVIIDFIGAPYLNQNLQSLRMDGRMVLLGLMGGGGVKSLSIAPILFKRLHILGSTLRSRSMDYKIKLTQDFQQRAAFLFDTGQLRPVIDSVFDWEEVGKAHTYMEANKNLGKIILKVNHP